MTNEPTIVGSLKPVGYLLQEVDKLPGEVVFVYDNGTLTVLRGLSDEHRVELVKDFAVGLFEGMTAFLPPSSIETDAGEPYVRLMCGDAITRDELASMLALFD